MVRRIAYFTAAILVALGASVIAGILFDAAASTVFAAGLAIAGFAAEVFLRRRSSDEE
jgi:hypothetical protein